MPTSWLPPLILLSDHGGDWESFFETVYASFRADFEDSRPVFRGVRLGLKKHPLLKGKSATFWHMISEGEVESERLPDLRRCERIQWPRPIIEASDDPNIKVWENRRKNRTRICLWFEAVDYLVILEKRDTYMLPWTAYLVQEEHTKRKLEREYQAFLKASAALVDGAVTPSTHGG